MMNNMIETEEKDGTRLDYRFNFGYKVNNNCSSVEELVGKVLYKLSKTDLYEYADEYSLLIRISDDDELINTKMDIEVYNDIFAQLFGWFKILNNINPLDASYIGITLKHRIPDKKYREDKNEQ